MVELYDPRYVHIEGNILPALLNQDHRLSYEMAHSEFVEDVGVSPREIRDHELIIHYALDDLLGDNARL